MKICIAGFDRLLPQQETLLDALRNCGVEVEVIAPASVADTVDVAGVTGTTTDVADAITSTESNATDTVTGTGTGDGYGTADNGDDDDADAVTIAGNTGTATTTKIRYHNPETPADEWRDAACWARDKLAADPQTRVAIVAPNLADAAPAIEYALAQALCPRRLAAPATSADLPYHLSLGAPLSRHPVAAAALILLAPVGGAPLSLAAVGRLIRSPFMVAADAEKTARAKLEIWCRRHLPYQIYFADLVEKITAPDSRAPSCPALFAALKKLPPTPSKKAAAALHAKHFAEVITCLGWHGERGLNSDEYQAARAFRRQLQNLARLDRTAAPMSSAAALGWLRQQLDAQPFQVESHDAAVQVLGVRGSRRAAF